MEIQQLRHLIAAADSSSYAKGAKKCFTSRQNVAHSVKAIEAELDVSLFVRKGNGIVLTREGHQAVAKARRVIEELDGLRVMFASLNPDMPPLKVAVSTNLFAGIPPLVDDYFASHKSELALSELSPRGCHDSVTHGRCDVSVVMCMKREFSECKAVELMCTSAYLLVSESSSLAKAESIAVEDLLDQRILLMSWPVFQYEGLIDRLDQVGYERSNFSVITSTSSMIHMVKTRGSVGIVSRRFAENPPSGTRAIPFADNGLNWYFYALYLVNEDRSQEIIKFVRDIEDGFQKTSSGGVFLSTWTFYASNRVCVR